MIIKHLLTPVSRWVTAVGVMFLWLPLIALAQNANLPEGTVVRFEGHGKRIVGAKFSDDGASIISADSEGLVFVWNSRTGAIEKKVSTGERLSRALGIAKSKSRATLLADDQFVFDIDLTSRLKGERQRDYPWAIGYRGEIALLLLAGGSLGGFLQESSGRTVNFKTARALRAAEIDAGGNYAVYFQLAGETEEFAQVWSTTTGALEYETRIPPLNAKVQSLAVEADLIAMTPRPWMSDSPVQVQIWGTETTHEVFALAGHQSAVTTLAFSKDGSHLLSGSEDSTLLVWDLSALLARRDRLGGTRRDLTTEIESLFNSKDAQRGLVAKIALLSFGDTAVNAIEKRLERFGGEMASTLGEETVSKLGSAVYKEREMADKKIRESGIITQALKDAQNSRDPEIRYRAEALVAYLISNQKASPELPARRLVSLLDQIHTPAAKRLLKKLTSYENPCSHGAKRILRTWE
jgi:WD domain, G-beta repeat